MFGFSKKGGKSLRKNRPVTRPARLGLESLDGRVLLSVAPVLAMPGGAGIYQPPVVNPVPNLSGYSFRLLSADGSPAHDLAIQSETIGANGNATFTGTWHGEGGNDTQAVTGGQIYRDATGNIKISFSWGTDHAFTGTLTKVSNPYVYTTEYYLDGTVTVNGVPGGPGHVTGYGSHPLVAAPCIRFQVPVIAWPPVIG
jgi:hypothetical protein